MTRVCFSLLPLLLLTGPVLSQEAEKKQEQKERTIPEPKAFVSRHEGRFGGVALPYTATAREYHLNNKEGKPAASVWSVAYTRDEVKDQSRRPVMFVFNGGPGSASVWLHMGLFGPRRAAVPSDADADDGSAPYPIVNNDEALLDLTDIVFIDPVGTGFSTVIGEGKEEDFWGLNEDARSIAQFIRQWVTVHQRWNAPKFIAGESFGTTRAAAVTQELAEGGQDLALNGLILISQALDYTGSTPEHDNLIAYVTYLPTMAATAWYHGKAGQDKTLEAFLDEVRAFAIDEYAPALFRGNALDADRRRRLAERLAYFTGLSRKYIEQADLRILAPRFRKELLREEGLTIGGLDSRFTATEPDQVAEHPTIGDAASFSISSAYTAALNHYLATDLQVQMDRPYLTGNSAIYGKWNWRPVPAGQPWEPSYVNVARKLSNALRRNKDLRVLVANGYYDLVTPFFDAEFTFARHGILPERIDMKYYEGGHMMYTHEPDLKKLTADIRAFLSAAIR